MKTIVIRVPTVRPRNVVARSLSDPRFRKQVVVSKKSYSRKGRSNRHLQDGGHY